MFDVSNHARLNQQLQEPEDICMFREQAPVEPTRLVVLAVSVIVSGLAAPHLIAHDKHGTPAEQHDGGEEVLPLPVSELLDCLIVRRALDAAVPAPVLLTPVAVVLAI